MDVGSSDSNHVGVPPTTKKQKRSTAVMNIALLEAERQLRTGDEGQLRIPEICRLTGVNYGSIYHHFGSREGLIDAAYAEMFTKTVARDIEMIRDAVTNASTFGAFLLALENVLNVTTMGDERRASRATRLRILSASVTRPELRKVISAAQTQFTEELTKTIEICQRRGWMREEFEPKSVAVFVQVVIFGRNLDDLSAAPIPEREWATFMYHVLSLFLKPS